jgi:hypothetical protein
LSKTIPPHMSIQIPMYREIPRYSYTSVALNVCGLGKNGLTQPALFFSIFLCLSKIRFFVVVSKLLEQNPTQLLVKSIY